MVNDLIGADAQVVLQLLEESRHLRLVNMAEPTDEILLHEEYALRNILQVLTRHVLLCLSYGDELCQQLFTHEVDDFLQSSSFCHNVLVYVKIAANVQNILNPSKQLRFFMTYGH